MAEFQKLCLGSFTKSRHGPVHQKSPLPPVALLEDMTSEGLDEATSGLQPRQKFQDVIDQTVHHALINQSQTLVNTLQNLILRTID
uniref:Uncharacterized protein n=1 Tax=Arundo donax TaxID=35708 RepID=A0A0A9DHG0_ARUDO